MITKAEKFHCSDVAAFMMPDMRVRWGQSDTGLTLLVKKDSTQAESTWCLVYCPNEEAIELSPDGKFWLPPEALPKIGFKSVKEGEHLPTILEKAWTEYFKNQVPPPRYETNEVLVTAETAQVWEEEFYNNLVAPYVHNHEIYAVAHSGVALAERLGLDAKPIYIRHYDESTYQDDDNVGDMFEVMLPASKEKQILIIDDMVSSRRTAREIINYFKGYGYDKVRFVALYNVQASNECPDVTDVETYKNLSNFYWVYGRGMDLFANSSRKLPDIYGAEKRYLECESEANVNELKQFFNLLNSDAV